MSAHQKLAQQANALFIAMAAFVEAFDEAAQGILDGSIDDPIGPWKDDGVRPDTLPDDMLDDFRMLAADYRRWANGIDARLDAWHERQQQLADEHGLDYDRDEGEVVQCDECGEWTQDGLINNPHHDDGHTCYYYRCLNAECEREAEMDGDDYYR